MSEHVLASPGEARAASSRAWPSARDATGVGRGRGLAGIAAE